MNLLYVAPFLHVPPDSGGAIRAFHLIRYLALRHTVSVITYETDMEGELRRWAYDHLIHLIVLPIATRRTSLEGRAEELRRLLSFPPEFFSNYPIAPVIAAIDEIFARRPRPEVIIFDTILVGQAITLKKWPVTTILSLYDVASNYQRRLFNRLNWCPHKFAMGVEWLKVWQYEMQIVRSFQIITAVSQQDVEFVRRMNSSARVFCVPNGVDTRELIPSKTQGNAVIFVGNWDYAPNAEGLQFLYEQVWPRIRLHLNTQLLVVGRHPPAWFLEITKNDPSVQIAANVPDVRPYYARAFACVVPLLAGEGTRLKILEAFALGVPVVSTTIGCEGLEVQDGKTLLIADGPEAFASAVIRLYCDSAQGEALANSARALVESHYEWEIIARSFQTELERLMACE